jgi:hypothetical protein
MSLRTLVTASYTATTSSATSTTISTTNANWTANAFGPFSSKPHVIRFLSGIYQGRQFPIESNTSDTITLTTNGVDLTAANGKQYSIFPVATLQSLFGATAPPSLTTSSDSTHADNILVRGSSDWITYYNDGTHWFHQGGGTTIDDNIALLPETGFLFVRRGSTTYNFSVTGAVPTTSLVTDLPANKTLLFANRFPVDITLTEVGIAQAPGWKAGNSAADADNVLIRGSFGWLTYYFDGTNWIRSGPKTVEDPTIPIGGAVLVVRRAGSDTTLDEAKPY